MTTTNGEKMRVLIACERSGRVRRAFRGRGFDAWSNDIEPADDGSPHHIQGDCVATIIGQRWDLIIMHPDCTKLAVSGNRWYGKGMPRHQERLDAIDYTEALWDTACENARHVALENPVGVLPRGFTQYIHPWQYGHGETKKTGLRLHNLPELAPTDIVAGRENRIWKMAPSETRKADRSITYLGWADAMAEQWGNYLLASQKAIDIVAGMNCRMTHPTQSQRDEL